jgi:glycosyltransferase involved in cell wall biosynthesis
MRIAFVSDAIYPYNKGGKEKRLYEMSTRLAAMGHEVHIYSMKWWDGPKDRIEHGVHLHGISKLRPLYDGERRSIKQGVLFSIDCLKLFFKKFDVIDVDHMPFFPLYTVWLVCLLRRKKMFATWHEVWGPDYWKGYLGDYKGKIGGLIEQLSVRLPSMIVSISPHTTTQLKKKLQYSKPITTIACGLDFQKIMAAQPKEIDNDVMYAGRLMQNKRVDLILLAIAELKKTGQDTKCIIVGEGPEKPFLKKLAHTLGITDLVKFHDFYEKDSDIYGLMKASKVFAFPSEREGFGMVAIEANACGTPVVTNLAVNNAAKDLVSHGDNGFHFDETAGLFANSLRTALDEYESLKQQCLDSAQKFDWDTLVNKLSEAYAQ